MSDSDIAKKIINHAQEVYMYEIRIRDRDTTPSVLLRDALSLAIEADASRKFPKRAYDMMYKIMAAVGANPLCAELIDFAVLGGTSVAKRSIKLEQLPDFIVALAKYAQTERIQYYADVVAAHRAGIVAAQHVQPSAASTVAISVAEVPAPQSAQNLPGVRPKSEYTPNERTLMECIDEGELSSDAIGAAMSTLATRFDQMNVAQKTLVQVINGVTTCKPIRVTEDGKLMSAADIIQIVCQNSSSTYASHTLASRPEEVRKLFVEKQFPGARQRLTPAGDFRAIIHLVMTLPSKCP